MPEKKIIAIADPHLGAISGDVDAMAEFINSIDPNRFEILFLGDLFHIWAGPAKYHTSTVKRLLNVLKTFQLKGGVVHLVVGNRDVFMPEVRENKQKSHLPFNSVSNDSIVLVRESGKLMAFHGDTINSQDKNYLRWRRLIRTRLFRLFFNMIPASRVKKIMLQLEEKLKHTNMAFRNHFPTEEWEKFVSTIIKKNAPSLLIAGHFHPKQPVVLKSGFTTAVVVPDWCTTHGYLEINNSLDYRLHYFKKEE